MLMLRPSRRKKGTTSSTKWLTKVSKRWNHQGERCMKYEMGLGTGCVCNKGEKWN